MNERKPPKTIALPTDWTPEQADAVLGFLVRLADAVFLAYEGPLRHRGHLDALGYDEHDAQRDDAPDDPIPF